MDFYEVLNQIHELLRRRGRVAYRALKRQFDLDDEDIEALKDELIYAQQVAADEDNRVLVWAGSADRPPVSVSPPVQTSDQPTIDANQPARAESPSPEPRTPDAERRQLTVMFCDLADSTRLSGQLDPEDLRDVIRAYQSTSVEVIERYDGYVAQHLGDGLMVYFGWPQAHEDDAQRAVRAGLGILEALSGLNARLEQETGIRLVIRIGIHTGLVVVGEVGSGASQEHLALGETPNIASRLEGVAEPDSIAISDATLQLVEGYFSCQDLGEHGLKGVAESMRVYRVISESGAQSRLDIVSARGLTPLVGRESETTLLLERWEQVKAGQGQVILLSGEAGIGKSRLLQVLRDHVAGEPHTRLECRSSPYYQNTALYPITGMLQRVLNWHQDDTPEAKLDKLEQTLRAYRLALAEAFPLFAALLSLPIPENRYPPLNMSPQQQRQKTLAMIAAMLLHQTEQQPVLFIVEDLHWTDPSTLELLDLLIDQTPTAAICVLLTCRPTFQPPWSSRSYLTPIVLNRLSPSQIENMAERVTDGKRLPAEVLQQIVEKTDGVPLFVEEMTKAVVESGALKDVNGRYELAGSFSALTIPATLQDSLMARLDRLVTAKGVAQYAAVIGRQFSFDLLAAICQLDAAMLQHELGRLVEAEILYQRGLPPRATYVFKHALIQDTAYESLLKSTRQQIHQKVAQHLEEQFPDMVEAQPELVAYHYTAAGLGEPAVSYWQRAGDLANRRSAYVEAIAHVTQGLSVLETLPETPGRVDQEIRLQLALGRPLLATHGVGAPQVGEAYARLRQLSGLGDDLLLHFTALRGLRTFYTGRAEYHRAMEMGAESLRVAQQRDDPMLLAEGYFNAGAPYLYLGQLQQAIDHFSKALVRPGSVSQMTAGAALDVTCRSHMSIVLWLLGYPDQARQRSHEALALSLQRSDVFTQAMAQLHSLLYLAFCREWTTLYERSVGLEKLAATAGLPQMAGLAAIMLGWHCAVRDRNPDGIVQLKQGIETFLNTGGDVFYSSWLAHLAESLAQIGKLEEALGTVAKAFEVMQANDEYVHHAELCWLKGTLLLLCHGGRFEESVSCFHQALDISRHQQAKSLELRAATSLARLWQSQGKRQEAYELLEPVYEWFTEGFDTADLKEAKALLQELEE